MSEPNETKEERVDGVRSYYRNKYQKIDDLPGIGEASAAKLRKEGFKSVESISTATVEELMKAELGEETARKVIAAARKCFALEYITGEELLEIQKSHQFLTTGCSSLDLLMERADMEGKPKGLPTGGITEFSGANGAGKSQMSHQLCCTVQLPREQGGLEGNALYIDTENVFTPSRVISIAQRFPYLKEKGAKILKNIVYAEAYTSEHQMALIESADDVIKENNVKLVVIDSLTGNFRSEYLGRETLAARQQQLNKHMHKLMRIARSYNLVAVVTNQVEADPTPYSGYDPKPVGGHVVGHTMHDRVFIRKGKDENRIAKILKSPYLPEGETSLKLTNWGLVGEGDMPKEDDPK